MSETGHSRELYRGSVFQYGKRLPVPLGCLFWIPGDGRCRIFIETGRQVLRTEGRSEQRFNDNTNRPVGYTIPTTVEPYRPVMSAAGLLSVNAERFLATILKYISKDNPLEKLYHQPSSKAQRD